MPPTDVPRGSPADWLRHARSDLVLARSSRADEDVLPETLCFHAQQAVEKAVKAVLVSRGVSFPKTHNIGVLVDLLPPKTPHDAILDEAAGLTEYAVSSRYPGEAEDVTQEELSLAVSVAEQVIAWATTVVAG
jgi:HEPN domain-containing protein